MRMAGNSTLGFAAPPDGIPINERGREFEELLRERILVLDGATGTYLQGQQLTAEDFGGPELEGCNENLCLTRPEVVKAMHRAYFDAGADIVSTNSFGSTPLVLGEYGLAEKSREISAAAARLAREAAAGFDGTRLVAGSMGPTTRAISVTGGVTFSDLVCHFQTQATGLVGGGA